MGKKSILLIAGGILVFITVLVLMFVSAGPGTSDTPQTSLDVTKDTEDFTLKLPQKWTEKVTQMGSDVQYTYRPSILPDGYTTPSIIVQLSPTNRSLVESKKAMARGFKFDNESITVSGIPAEIYRGAFPLRTVAGNIIKKSVRYTIVLFETENQYAAITYEYDGEIPNPEADTFFRNVLDTFQLL